MTKAANTPTPQYLARGWRKWVDHPTRTYQCSDWRPLNLAVYWKSLFCDHNFSGPADGTAVVWVYIFVACNIFSIQEGGVGYGAASASARWLHRTKTRHSKKTDFIAKRLEYTKGRPTDSNVGIEPPDQPFECQSLLWVQQLDDEGTCGWNYDGQLHIFSFTAAVQFCIDEESWLSLFLCPKKCAWCQLSIYLAGCSFPGHEAENWRAAMSPICWIQLTLLLMCMC